MKHLQAANLVPFPVLKGQRLRAVTKLAVFVPANILEPGGIPLKELIKLSDQNAYVGLQESSRRLGKIMSIVVYMKPGDEMCLGRSSEIAVDGVREDGIAFELVSE
jgi:hypothetical protein